MAKRLNKAAQAARDAMIQRVEQEAIAPWRKLYGELREQIRELVMDSENKRKSHIIAIENLVEQLEDTKRSRNAMILAFALAAALIATAVTYAVMADNRPVSIHVTPPINTPIVAYTPNGWHQAYVDISGNIRSMDTGMKIKNATSWMKP